MSKLFYIIGASGAGKDTLINYARRQINGSEKVIFAHRYITRPPFADSENHVSLSHEEFEARQRSGLFALHWSSHGNHYGIGREIDSWMEKGFKVVVNGSREYLPIARQLYPDINVILITASPHIIGQRLAARGREDAAEIARRLARNATIGDKLEDCIQIQNDGTPEDAGTVLVKLISFVNIPTMSANYWEIIRKAYTGFNERNIDHVFSIMHPTVHWPKAFEGGYVIGYDAVRNYWTKQWTEINPVVQPLSITERPDGKVEVKVDQLVKGLDGSILFDGKVKHIYVIENDLIMSMDVEGI